MAKAPTPQQVIEWALATFIIARGPIIASDVPVLTEKIWTALLKTKAEQQAAEPPASPPTPPPIIDKNATAVLQGSAVEAALKQCGQIVTAAEGLPDIPGEFIEVVRGISETIEKRQYVTTGQQEAIDNMEVGVAAWLMD